MPGQLNYDQWQRQYGFSPNQYGGWVPGSALDATHQGEYSAYQKDYAWQHPAGSAPQGVQFPDPTPYFDPSKINSFYNQGAANLYQSMNRSAAGAQRTAAATSGNMLSPSAYITGAGSQVRSSYTPAFAGLETSRAGALNQQQQDLFKALGMKSQFEQQASQFDTTTDLQRQQMGQQWKMFLQQMQAQQDQQGANGFDWASLGIGGIAGLLKIPGIAKMLGLG